MVTQFTYRQRLGRIYERVVGYNPAEEDPEMGTIDLAVMLREVMGEHVAAGEPLAYRVRQWR